VPDDTTLIRWANLREPTTLKRLLDHVVDLARQHHVTRGRKLRLDSTVVATNIHYPVDSTLLADTDDCPAAGRAGHPVGRAYPTR
jgi:transposase, IS5 family